MTDFRIKPFHVVEYKLKRGRKGTEHRGIYDRYIDAEEAIRRCNRLKAKSPYTANYSGTIDLRV